MANYTLDTEQNRLAVLDALIASMPAPEGINPLEASRGSLLQQLTAYHRGESHHTPTWKRVLFRWREQRYAKKQPTPGAASGKLHLFFVSELSHLHQLVPIADALLDKGIQTRFLTTKPKVYQQLRGTAHVAQLVVVSATPAGAPKQWAKALRQAMQTMGLPETVRKSLLATLAPQWAVWKALQLALFHLAHQATIHHLAIGNCLTFEGRWVALWAQTQSLATWSVQHGAISQNSLYKYLNVDRFFAYGNRDQEQLEALGVEPERLAVSGAPYLDTPPSPVTTPLAQHLPIPPETKPVLVMLSGYGHMTSKQHYFQILEVLFRWINATPNVHVVFKLHRKDKAEHFEGYVTPALQARVSVIPYTDTRFPQDVFYWLQQTSLLITGNSSVAKEAMLVQVPVVSIDLTHEYPTTDFIAEGVSSHITQPDQVTEQIEALRTEETHRTRQIARQTQFIQGHFANVSTRNAVATLLDQLPPTRSL